MLIERPKMTRTMYQALKRNIMRERERIKQEQEQDEAMERLKKERELRKKKQEEDSLTLEQTKEQLGQLEKRLDELKKEKHMLFSQLKKVLHQEDETKKKAQQKENEMVQAAIQYPQPGMVTASHPAFLHSNMVRQSARYLNSVQQNVGVKRARSPSPPPSGGIYGGYNSSSGQKYPATYNATVKQEPYIHRQKFLDPRYSNPPGGMVKQEPYPPPTTQQSMNNYPTPSTPVTFATQSGHQYQQAQPAAYQTSQAPSTKPYSTTPAGQSQSAFSSYSGHYPHQQKGMSEHYPSGFQVQRVPQPGYLGSQHTSSNLPLQQQLEHANQKSGFSEDKYKVQQVKSQQLRGVPQGVLASPQPHSTSSAQVTPSTASGSIVQGFPVRTTSSYQPPSSTQGQSSQSSGRPYSGQAPGRYY